MANLKVPKFPLRKIVPLNLKSAKNNSPYYFFILFRKIFFPAKPLINSSKHVIIVISDEKLHKDNLFRSSMEFFQTHLNGGVVVCACVCVLFSQCWNLMDFSFEGKKNQFNPFSCCGDGVKAFKKACRPEKSSF